MVKVSVIVPLHNAAQWLEESLFSAAQQQLEGELEISVYNDGSTDDSGQLLAALAERLRPKVQLVVSGHEGRPRGCGFAKNRAVEQSSGQFLCFLDADDVMLAGRIQQQLSLATANPDCLIGCRFHREPAGSTRRFVDWANSLDSELLTVQVYMSHGPTVVMPTWFMRRSVFDRVGGFKEVARGFPEDLDFFYRHLDAGGGVLRAEADLLLYRFHPAATTFSIHESTIFDLRLERLVRCVLLGWRRFTIWNAGRQGRRLYRALPPELRQKVAAFCDVDEKKIASGCYRFEESRERPVPTVPIVHFSAATPPLIVCAKPDMTGGQLEANVASLQLVEGRDYHWFS